MVESQKSFIPQDFFAEIAGLVETNCGNLGFPAHEVSRLWGRRDIIALQLSRPLLAWEAALMQGNELETAQARMWRDPAVVDLLLTRWDLHFRRRFNISVKKMHCLPRFVAGSQEIGYEVIELTRPLFIEPVDSGVNGFGRNMGSRKQLHPNWTEERLNVELCRLLRESGGKGPNRCRFLMLDEQCLLILLSGVLSEGMINSVDGDPKLAVSLENIAKRQLLNCTRNLLRELDICLKRFRHELDLEDNAAVIMALM
ncbi:MAG: hypothetical protein GYA36_01390 [Veillonellaceae bacterium]|jgi:hypothetical protein|nr:hypothetical protein [Veillonellaceae bacterium]